MFKNMKMAAGYGLHIVLKETNMDCLERPKDMN